MYEQDLEYDILKELEMTSRPRLDDYCKENNCFIKSGLEKLSEPWTGSDSKLKVYIYNNYMPENKKTGPITLLIVIREIDTKEVFGDFAVKQVEQAIYPLYMIDDQAIDIPPAEEAPKFHPDVVKFILEKRNLPKKPYNKPPEENVEYKWDVNKIAEALSISNRLVAKFCRAKNI